MSQRDLRLIGGVYQTGQVLTTTGILTNYTAYNRNTNDVVGLFVLELPATLNVQRVQQLLQPLERRRLVESPHVLRVYDWGIDGNRAYIATDPPRGLTLRHVLDNENIDLQRALDLARQMVHGLIALHAQGIVGVDLRPHLITVDSIGITDRVQLDDVGLRTLLNELGYANVNSQRVDDIGYFDPRYMAPEYITGGPIGPWSDMYQLGLLVFELVTGRVPFVGRNSAETGILQSTSPPPPMVQYKHDTPAVLQAVVDRTLAKNPTERFAHAGELLSALETVQLSARPDGRIEEAPTTPPSAPRQSTGEMAVLEGDITLRPTVIEGRPAPVTNGPTQGPSTGENADSTEAGVYAYLCYEKAGVETQRFAITKPKVLVGRLDPKRGLHPDVDLTALDPKMTVSRQHARISYAESFFYIEDLKSHNKTRLGELTLIPLKPELLQHGDVVQFGAVRLVFKVAGNIRARSRP